MNHRTIFSAACFAFALSGCAVTNHALLRETAQLEAPQEQVARTLFRLARDCWKVDETLLTARVVVENVVTLDSIVVSARFDSFGSAVLNPFLKFVVSASKGTTTVELLTQEISWRGREQHMRDAKRWMAGEFVCA